MKDFAGNVTSESLYPVESWQVSESPVSGVTPAARFTEFETAASAVPLGPGQMGGVLADTAGGVLPGAKVTVRYQTGQFEKTTVTDDQGRWVIVGAPSGRVTVIGEMSGFNTTERVFRYDASRAARVDMVLQVGALSEMMVVSSDVTDEVAQATRNAERQARKQAEAARTAPSANVSNLQRRVAGVLPIGVEVPRAGKAYRFLRPLVLDEETTLSFRYKSK